MLIAAWGLNLVIASVLAHLALNLFLSHRKQRQARYLIAFVLCIGCYSLHPFFRWEILSTPETGSLLLFFGLDKSETYRVHIGLWLFSEMVPWTLWMFLRSVCRDTKDSFWVSFLPFAVVMLTNIYVVYNNFNVALFLHFSNGVNFLLLLMGLYELLHDFKADLSNRRRRFRNFIILFLMVQILLIFYMETSYPMWKNVGWLLATRIVVLIASLLVSLLYFQASAEAISEIFYYNRVMHENRSPLSPESEKLLRLLEVETLYKNPDLSVARLAEQMSVPEYRLRDLIKTELGFRNFNAFINKFRVEYAVKQFQENSSMPIAAIRAEAGFKSHPPFNRAFREIHGVSPAEYRDSLKKKQAAVLESC